MRWAKSEFVIFKIASQFLKKPAEQLELDNNK
jgi:hypothetical protein